MTKKKQTTKKQVKTRTKTLRNRSYEKLFESDGEYFLKLVLCIVLGTLWLKFAHPMSWIGVPIRAFPIGLLLGLVLVSKFERFQADRKIWYAVLVIVAIISNFAAAGIII